MSRLAACCLLAIALSASDATAQSRFWDNSTSGLWADASRWSLNDVPDTLLEEAIFDGAGVYAVSLPESATIAIKAFQMTRGELTLQSEGVGTANLSLAEDANVSGELTLRYLVGDLNFTVGGAVRLENGSSLRVEEAGYSATATIIPAGSISEITEMTITDSEAVELGDTEVAAEGSADYRGALSLYGDTTANVGNLGIAHVDGDLFGELNVIGSTLTQTSGASKLVTVGAMSDEATGRAGLVAAEGGRIALESILIQSSGVARNVGSTFEVSQSLQVVGGEYTESGAAARDFSGLTQLQVQQGGLIALVGDPLAWTNGALLVEHSTLESEGGLFVSLAGHATFTGESTIGGDTTIQDTGQISISSDAKIRFEGDFTNDAGGLQIASGATATFAGEYNGAGSSQTGDVVFEGRVELSVDATFGGGVAWTSDASYDVMLAESSDPPLLTAAGIASLAGDLAVQLEEDWTPTAGDAFTVLAAAGLTGGFDSLTAPELPGGLVWRTEVNPTSLTLSVVEASIAGDANHDGMVDAADYSLIRDSIGATGPALMADTDGDGAVTTEDIAMWASHYGMSRDSATSIPEPTTLAGIACALVIFWRRSLLD